MNSKLIKKPDIIIVDDHLIFRQGLKAIISIENIANVIGEASDGKEFIGLLSHLKPDLVLMDIDMPNMNGMEATQKALELMPGLKIIAFTMFGDQDYYTKMIGLGVKGFILKSSGINELEKAVQYIMRGENYFSNEQSGKLASSFRIKNANKPIEIANLTAREIEVQQQIDLGLTHEEIAQKLSISPKTVKSHKYNVLGKISCKYSPYNTHKNSDYWLS